MIEFEFYAKELRRRAAETPNPFFFAVDKNGNMVNCEEIGCSKCIFYNQDEPCLNKRFEFLLKEHKKENEKCK